MLEVSELPKEFRDIRKFERVLIARRLLFKKISIMLKGQPPKLKGTLCNVLTDVVDVYKTLPRGENVMPELLTNDKFCEELSHPHLFPTGKFGFQTKRKVQLSPSKYFNQRLLNYIQKFSSDSDYIFFAQSVIQKLNISNQINIAMRKVTSNQLTAGLPINFNEKIKEFTASDQAFTFMNSIKGTPAYWKKFLFDVLAMVN